MNKMLPSFFLDVKHIKITLCSKQINRAEQHVFWLEAPLMSPSQKSIEMLALSSLDQIIFISNLLFLPILATGKKKKTVRVLSV